MRDFFNVVSIVERVYLHLILDEKYQKKSETERNLRRNPWCWNATL
jgi:hypothetical protein